MGVACVHVHCVCICVCVCVRACVRARVCVRGCGDVGMLGQERSPESCTKKLVEGLRARTINILSVTHAYRLAYHKCLYYRH